MSQTTQDAPLAPKRSGVPVIGSAVAFARDPYALYDDIASHGDVVRFSLGSYDMATVLHPDGIEQVLVDDFDRFDKPGAAASGADVLADGLLLSDGEQWHRQRTGLQPLFYRERIETYADTMATYAAAAADEWAAADAVDLGEATSTYTLRVLGKTLFGIDTDEYREAVRAGAEAILERTSQNPVAMDIPQWLPTPSNRRYERGIDRLDGVVADLLADREPGSDREDLLSLLVDMRSDGELDEAEIRSQLVTFLFAGHETTATALTWTLAELGRNPGVARRLRAEVDAVLDGACATLADLPDLTYTEQVVRETLRRYPPASAVFRETDEPVTVVSIGPTPSLAAALQDDPEIAESCRFVGMHGSFYRGYDGDEEPSAEANVRIDPDAFRAVLDAPWRDVLLTPLDTCGLVTLTGDRYNRVWRSTDDPLVRSVIESNCVFAPRVPWWPYEDFTRQSSTLFDSVAVYLAVDESFVETRTERFDVTDDGFTEPDSDGEFEARIALEWRDLDAFEAYLVDVLLEA